MRRGDEFDSHLRTSNQSLHTAVNWEILFVPLHCGKSHSQQLPTGSGSHCGAHAFMDGDLKRLLTEHICFSREELWPLDTWHWAHGSLSWPPWFALLYWKMAAVVPYIQKGWLQLNLQWFLIITLLLLICIPHLFDMLNICLFKFSTSVFWNADSKWLVHYLFSAFYGSL